MDFSIYTKEFSQNIKLAYPVILGMIGHTLIGIVDNIMVGKLGPTELAAVSLGNSFIFIALSLGIGFSSSITPLIAEADAKKNPDEIRSTFIHGLFLCSILAILLFLVILLAKPIMYYMQQPKEVVELAYPYINWVAFSLIPVIVYQAYKQFADGLSQTKYAMYSIFMANVVHIIINYLLINGISFFPKLGIIGAALGTVISRILMLLFMHYLLINNPDIKKYFASILFNQIKKKMLNKIINLGIPTSMQMLFEVALFTAAIWLSGTISENSQAANQIALTLATVTFMFAMGLSVTSMIRVSNQKGLNDYRYLLTVARSIFLLAILLEVVFAIFFILFHNYLPHFFLDMQNQSKFIANQEVIKITSNLLIIAAIFQIFDGIQVVVLGALRGLQDVKIPMYITFVSYWIFGFPLCFYLGLYTPLKTEGIWIGLLSGLTFAAIFLYIRFNYLTKKLIKKNNIPLNL